MRTKDKIQKNYFMPKPPEGAIIDELLSNYYGVPTAKSNEYMYWYVRETWFKSLNNRNLNKDNGEKNNAASI